MYVSGKLPTYPSPNLTLTLSFRLGKNVKFGEGWVGSFQETYIDPVLQQTLHKLYRFYFGCLQIYDIMAKIRDTVKPFSLLL